MRVRALMAGFSTYIAKPVEPAELTAVIVQQAGRVKFPTTDLRLCDAERPGSVARPSSVSGRQRECRLALHRRDPQLLKGRRVQLARLRQVLPLLEVTHRLLGPRPDDSVDGPRIHAASWSACCALRTCCVVTPVPTEGATMSRLAPSPALAVWGIGVPGAIVPGVAWVPGVG